MQILLWSQNAITHKKKKIGVMKDELGGKTMKELVIVKSKMYNPIADDAGRKEKETKKCILKREIKYEDYKNV